MFVLGSRRGECSNRPHYACLDKRANRPPKVLNEEGQPRASKSRTPIFGAVHDAVRPSSFAIRHHVNGQSTMATSQCSEHIVGQQPSGQLIW